MNENKRKIGQDAERAVAAFLKRRGYDIVERNYYCRSGEIDLIARQGKILVFVEVKCRSNASFGTPAAAVTPAKIKKILQTAQDYLYQAKLQQQAVRFDVAEVFKRGGEMEIRLIENAFDAG